MSGRLAVLALNCLKRQSFQISFSKNGGVNRRGTPVGHTFASEFAAAHEGGHIELNCDFATGARNNWDVLSDLQITISDSTSAELGCACAGRNTPVPLAADGGSRLTVYATTATS